VKLSKLNDKEKENSLNEVRILASIKYVTSFICLCQFRHKNVISYKEAFIEEESECLCIIMEFADAGDL
jgi:NIMA (never in mitosis gene a)-related kinase 1/4/5